MEENLTSLIPIDLKRRAKDIINKAVLIASDAEKSNVKVIFGHNNRNTRQDKAFIKAIKNYSNVTLCQANNKSELINVSQLRNLAFRAVDTELIVLLDVDIFSDFSLFIRCANEILNQSAPFHILPCLYLTKYGTNYLRKKKALKALKKNTSLFRVRNFCTWHVHHQSW